MLGQAIVAQGLQNVAAGANPMLIKHGLEKGVAAIVVDLERQSRPVETHADITAVAAISAADAEVGEMIADVMDKVGKDGVITVEEGQAVGLETGARSRAWSEVFTRGAILRARWLRSWPSRA